MEYLTAFLFSMMFIATDMKSLRDLQKDQHNMESLPSACKPDGIPFLVMFIATDMKSLRDLQKDQHNMEYLPLAGRPDGIPFLYDVYCYRYEIPACGSQGYAIYKKTRTIWNPCLRQAGGLR